MSIDIEAIIREWWDAYQADPRASYDNIVSGMRKGQSTDSGYVEYEGGVRQPIVKSQRQTGSCQYFINGLSAPCSNWHSDALECSFEFEDIIDRPSGYGVGKCDMLGRRNWCTKYSPSKPDNLSEFVCVAPCMERSGLGKQMTEASGTLSFRPVFPDEIQGYNADDEGVGRCDGWGLGRGSQREEYKSIEELYEDGSICRYYRPQQMGFGAIQPHPYHGSEFPGKPYSADINTIPETLEELHDGSNADPLVLMPKRVPFVFQVYNSRALYQKCAHWKNNSPTFFVMSTEGDISVHTITLAGNVNCECTDSACDPYKTYEDTWPIGVPWMLSEVIAKYGGIICNGAKPECPCYTGKWIYCTDNNMRDGMRITADQLFELRFWAASWASKEEYEDFYMQKPGPTSNSYADETTVDIYTFTEWQTLNATESIMGGYKHSMCMPAPLNMREFTTEDYVTKTPVTYPKANTFTGTNVLGKNVAFPTLVRELEDPDYFTPDINVIYPYFTVDPWAVEICQQEELVDFCIHNFNSMIDPTISVIGQTSLERPLYIVNTSLIENSVEVVKAKEYMDNYVQASQIISRGLDIWYDYNDRIDKFLTYCEKQEKGYYASETDKDVGIFNESGIELKPNTLNEFYIICHYSDEDFTEYIFRKVKVLSVYWGALITQDSMVHTHYSPTQFNSYPSHFEPGANITGKVDITRGEVSSVVPMYYHLVRGFTANKAYYGYCINEYEATEEDVFDWTQVGNSGYVWAEIDNLELNYLWNFEIVEAYLELREKEDADGNKSVSTDVNLCGQKAELGLQIPLTQIYAPRKEIPPNAVLLKAAQPMGFFKSDWKLVIKYKYYILEQFKTNPVWPANLGEDFSGNIFRSSPFTVDHVEKETSFSISNAAGIRSKATLSVMALITDEYGRVQTAAATKMLIQGYKQGNRNVEIEYAYIADAKSYQLQPLSGFATWIGPPKAIEAGDGGVHFRRPLCGDHDCTPGNCIGPMWYPFEDCNSLAFYDLYTPAAQSYLFINEGEPEVDKMGPGAWRYGVAEEYTPWVTEGGNWAATCGASWNYFYSHAEMSNMRWAGSAYKVAVIDTSHYDLMQWAPPPFSNAGRAYIDRFLSKDFFSFVDFSGNLPSSSEEYVPMVFNFEDLNTELNCFSGNIYTGGGINYYSMLNNYTASFIEEAKSTERYRFDDIIQPILHKSCSYPDNIVRTEDGYFVIRYGFKDESHVWAWPEYWNSIDRNIESTDNKFNFLNLERPSYYFDAIDKEHQFVPNEGEYTLIFQPPQPSNEDEDTSGKYPSISINGVYPRYFNIIYDSYDSETYVEWKDESDDGEIGSSNGESIYELANNGLWLHNFNTVFDNMASAEPDVDRMVYLGYDVESQQDKFGYFNRGLIINIPINRLKFLPVEVYSAETVTVEEENDFQYIGFWLLGGEYGVAPVEINMSGFYGKSTNDDGTVNVYGRPSIRVAESEDVPVFSVDNIIPDWPTAANSEVGYLPYIDGATIPTTESYSIKFELERTPTRLTHNLQYFLIKLEVVPGNELLLSSLEVKLGKYIYAKEKIKVWERKYHVGTASLPTHNADGPDTIIYRTTDRDGKNSGQYFPMNVNSSRGFGDFGRAIIGYDNEGNTNNGYGVFVEASNLSGLSNSSLYEATSTISKLNMTECTEFYDYKEEIEDVNLGNLKAVERDAQKELFEEATALDSYNDLGFTNIIPPSIEGWFNYVGEGFNNQGPMKLKYDKIYWDNSKYPGWLNQKGDFWQPAGHYFAWSEEIMKTKCYILGPIQTVYEAEMVHHGGTEKVMDAGHAYAGWGRVAYVEAKIWANQALGTDTQSETPDLLTGARNGVMGG